jgi:ubiquinone/menaquinone biosynthesis C-methylase UbiE
VQLIEGDFLSYQGFALHTFDAAICSLVVEHIQDLETFFQKLSLVLKTGGELFLSEIHPERALQGSLAHFKDPELDSEFHLQSHVHSNDQIQASAQRAGFGLVASFDGLGSPQIAAIQPKWHKYTNLPMIRIWTFQKQSK